jgi:hypothetical protein
MDSSAVNLVHSLFLARARGDWSSVEWAHPQIELAVADGPNPGTWTGVAGMTEGYHQVTNAWEGYSSAEEFVLLDDERVLVLDRLFARGKLSGLELEQMQPNAAGVFRVRGGKVVSIVLWYSRERALADLGLAGAPDDDA